MKGMPAWKKRKIKIAMHRKAPCCHYCNDPLRYIDATFDHVVPLSKGGTNAQHNLVLACQSCNKAKGDTMPDYPDEPCGYPDERLGEDR